jgi:hypothetical protein
VTTRPSLRELDRLMRERGGLAPLPVPVPLHKMGQRDDGGDGADGSGETDGGSDGDGRR